MTMRAVVRGLLAALAVFAAAAVHAATVTSPDNLIAFDLDVDEQGVPHYEIAYDGEPVVRRSRLGLRYRQGASPDAGLVLADSEFSRHDDTWEQPWGQRRYVRDHYHERRYVFEPAAGPGAGFALRVRVFDDGVGFRYEVPGQGDGESIDIVDELTEFVMPGIETAWWIPGRGWNRYEFLYRETALGEIAFAHTPMTARLSSGVHVSLHEAALVDYPAYVLKLGRNAALRVDLTPWSDGIKAKKRTPFVTPWRTIQIAPDAVGLLNSDLILNLNEPNVLGDVPWVEPGKYVGIWWAMHLNEHVRSGGREIEGARTWGSGPKHGATTAEAKRYIDFAAAHGFSGVLVEGWNTGWDGDWTANGDVFDFTEAHPDFDIEAVASYALERGVRLVGHHETSGHVANYESQIEDAFDLYESLGVRQVKTGYVAEAGRLERIDEDGNHSFEWHDGQFGVNHYLHVLERAAEHRIAINTHEPVKPTGLSRTYPNWISSEGARGQEFNAWGRPPNPPSHTAILPYTRLLGGPMDFTPGIFDLTFGGPDARQRVPTTLAKQLALYVVIYSPIQMVADLPENYARFPDAFRFIVDVPADWEESIALAGEVGDFVAFARRERGGDGWYVGALTDESPRTLSLPLDFLAPDVDYVATIYRDGEDAHWHSNPYDYVIEERAVDAGTTLELDLAAGGGAAVSIRPE